MLVYVLQNSKAMPNLIITRPFLVGIFSSKIFIIFLGVDKESERLF